MPRVKKVKPTVRKTKNKQKVVIRNVININSNNKRKGNTKPSFAQMTQPRTASTVVSHYVQNPQSAYNPQGESSLVKSMDIMNNLINKYAEREAVIYNDTLNRLKSTVGGAKVENPLQDASKGRRFTFDYQSLLNTPSGSSSVKSERSVKSEPAPSTPMKSLFGGQRPSPLGFPDGNTLSPLSRAGLTEAQVKRDLELMGATATTDDRNKGRKYLRQVYRAIGATAPEGLNTKPSTMVNDLLRNSREGIAKHWTAIKDIPNQFRLVSEAQGGGGKATKKVPERAKSK